MDGRYANYEAFIGVPWECSGCSGHIAIVIASRPTLEI
jgi:hypothetical protein